MNAMSDNCEHFAFLAKYCFGECLEVEKYQIKKLLITVKKGAKKKFDWKRVVTTLREDHFTRMLFREIEYQQKKLIDNT